MASTGNDNQPQLLQGIDRVPGLRQGLMLVALAASVALGVTAVLWIARPMHSALPPMQNMSEAQQMLKAAGIAVADEGDRLTVPVDDYARAKSLLVENNVVSADTRDCDKIPGSGSMGSSLQVEDQALNCHLEVEIARTLNNLRGVNHAVVHISTPPASAFIRPRLDTTASVNISLAPERQADRELARSIVHLVADAVPLLMPEHVTVVANGRMISDQVNGDGMMDLSNKQMNYQRALESTKEDQIREILSRTLGAEHYTVTVSSEIDFTVIEKTERRPTEAVVIGTTEQFTESPSGQAQPNGVPGGLTNTPIPTNADVEGQGDGGGEGNAGGGGRGIASRSVTTNREIGEVYEVVKQPIGALKLLTISVMLNELAPRAGAPQAQAAQEEATGDEGEEAAPAVPEPRYTAQELAKLESLIQNAVTFDADRGDRLTIESMPFQPMVYETPSPSPWWQSPLVIDLARQGLGALFVAALFFTTVRPMITKLMTTPPQVALPAGAYGQAAIGAEPGGDLEEPAQARVDHQTQVSEARDLAAKDPDRAAQILQSWVNG